MIPVRPHATASSPEPVRVGFVNPLMFKVCGNEPILRKFIDNKASTFTLVSSKSGILPKKSTPLPALLFYLGGGIPDPDINKVF